MGSAADFEIKNGILVRYSGFESKVTIPAGVKSIGDMAFWSNSLLTSVTIPKGVRDIGDFAFQSCSRLTRVKIPNSVKSIGDRAFTGCRGLADQEGFVIVRDVLYDYFGPAGDIRIPDRVTEIGHSAFAWNASLSSVFIPDSVRTIGPDAFLRCRGLTALTIPDSVTGIGDYAFSECSGLTKVTIPKSVTSIGYCAFSDCTGLTDIRLPEGIQKIGREAFSNCPGLTVLRIPASVKDLGINMFESCDNLIIAICLTPYAVSCVIEYEGPWPVYAGGPLSDLPGEERYEAAAGFIYALKQNIREIEQWREGYLDYIRDHAWMLIWDDDGDRTILRFLTGETLLDEESTDRILAYYDRKGDTEGKAALLRYRAERFGNGDLGDLSL